MKTGRENGVAPMGEKVRHSHIQNGPNLITTVLQLSAGKFLILFHGYMFGASTATSCIILLRNIEEKQSQHGRGLHLLEFTGSRQTSSLSWHAALSVFGSFTTLYLNLLYYKYLTTVVFLLSRVC